jgi:hypothetical protein
MVSVLSDSSIKSLAFSLPLIRATHFLVSAIKPMYGHRIISRIAVCQLCQFHLDLSSWCGFTLELR